MPSRRHLMAAAPGVLAVLAGVSAVAAASPVPSADAELIRLAARAAPLITEQQLASAAFFALPASHPDLECAAGREVAAAEQLDELLERALSLSATTLEGMRAKAILVRHELRRHNQMDGEIMFESTSAEAAWSLVSDLLAGAERARSH